VLLVKEPCKGDVGKPSMGLYRPYRAFLTAGLHNPLGLTPQAIPCRPFRAPEKCTQHGLCKWCPENENTETSPTLRTPGAWNALVEDQRPRRLPLSGTGVLGIKSRDVQPGARSKVAPDPADCTKARLHESRCPLRGLVLSKARPPGSFPAASFDIP